MSTELIAEFNVVSLNNDLDRHFHTWVRHLVSPDGEHDIIRIEQEEIDAENSVVILTRADFDRIASQLKGH